MSTSFAVCQFIIASLSFLTAVKLTRLTASVALNGPRISKSSIATPAATIPGSDLNLILNATLGLPPKKEGS
ncbi:MAG: hypothetical protein IPP81_15730 [Chitinophagaceae bacterium]|nr:hypothetical protein [Chitinophagaceae bacterium]